MEDWPRSPGVRLGRPGKPRVRLGGRTLSWKKAIAAALVRAALLLLAAACSAEQGIVITEPIARPSPLEGGTAGAFMTIRNAGGQADRLRSAASPTAPVVELHETVNDNGVMRMVPQPDGWEISPGSLLELKPGGKHVMLIGLVHPLNAGETIEITLNFEKAGAIRVKMPVKEMEQ